MLLAFVAVYGGAWLTTERFGASRAVAWLEPDTGDLHRFPSRPVPAGGPVLELPAGAPLDLGQLWGLADPWRCSSRPTRQRCWWCRAANCGTSGTPPTQDPSSCARPSPPSSRYLLLEGLVLQRATGRPVSEYLSERLWLPMGAEADASWSLDSDRSGFEKMESGLNAVARDDARFGLLYARSGRADGRQVVPESWVRRATSAQAADGPADFYAFLWLTRAGRGNPLPAGHALAQGNLGQYVYVAPDRDLVIVRLGDDTDVEDWPQRLAQLAERL